MFFGNLKLSQHNISYKNAVRNRVLMVHVLVIAENESSIKTIIVDFDNKAWYFLNIKSVVRPTSEASNYE